jgi:hypothetical protein
MRWAACLLLVACSGGVAEPEEINLQAVFCGKIRDCFPNDFVPTYGTFEACTHRVLQGKCNWAQAEMCRDAIDRQMCNSTPTELTVPDACRCAE